MSVIRTSAKAFAYQLIQEAIENVPDETLNQFLEENLGSFTEEEKLLFLDALGDIRVTY